MMVFVSLLPVTAAEYFGPHAFPIRVALDTEPSLQDRLKAVSYQISVDQMLHFIYPIPTPWVGLKSVEILGFF
jgi:hypothetical protein